MTDAQIQQLAYRLERLGLVYLRSFNRLRQALESHDDEQIGDALGACAPIVAAWTEEGMRQNAREHHVVGTPLDRLPVPEPAAPESTQRTRRRGPRCHAGRRWHG